MAFAAGAKRPLAADAYALRGGEDLCDGCELDSLVETASSYDHSTNYSAKSIKALRPGGRGKSGNRSIGDAHVRPRFYSAPSISEIYESTKCSVLRHSVSYDSVSTATSVHPNYLSQVGASAASSTHPVESAYSSFVKESLPQLPHHAIPSRTAGWMMQRDDDTSASSNSSLRDEMTVPRGDATHPAPLRPVAPPLEAAMPSSSTRFDIDYWSAMRLSWSEWHSTSSNELHPPDASLDALLDTSLDTCSNFAPPVASTKRHSKRMEGGSAAVGHQEDQARAGDDDEEEDEEDEEAEYDDDDRENGACHLHRSTAHGSGIAGPRSSARAADREGANSLGGDGDGLRRGKWSEEEKAYCSLLVELFLRGTLPGVRDGTTLRVVLAVRHHPISCRSHGAARHKTSRLVESRE